MKLTLRFLLPLIASLGIMAFVLVPFVEHLMEVWFIRDLDIRSRLIGRSVGAEVQRLLSESTDMTTTRKKLLKILIKATDDERLMALEICDAEGQSFAKTDSFPSQINCQSIDQNHPFSGKVLQLPSGSIHFSFSPIERILSDSEDSQPRPLQEFSARILTMLPLKLLIIHDMSFVDRRSRDTKIYMGLVFLCVGLVIAFLSLVIARWSRTHWIQGVQKLLGGIRNSDDNEPFVPSNQDFLPIFKDVKALVKELEATRQLQDESRINWNPSTLKEILKKQLDGERIIVVSNREPYIHQNSEHGITIQKPASGLVTALEPILRACSGTWVAHGSGTADRQVVDTNDRVQVPPDHPMYLIRRIWLSKEEEEGYYYGFANEGLWPLCHIAHTRPQFRSEDWIWYVKANQKFSNAVCEEATDSAPVILVQDYHLALAPRLIRERLPGATILSFWHIPWPNAESFGICPWKNEILAGLLGSSIVGFHTQFHCNNFMECVDRYLEARIDRETNTIIYKGKATQVRAYPISIEWPPQVLQTLPTAVDCRRIVAERHGLSEACKIIVGIDRLDYTKGIIERLRAVEKFLEKDNSWSKKFVFIQIGAPTRSTIPSYRDFALEVERTVHHINDKYRKDNWEPIVYLPVHHEVDQVYHYLRAAELCMVTSLHDGMNLVAKEYVAAHDDERGTLLLSIFAGASRELTGALIVNPYDIDQVAEGIRAALSMSLDEQRERMRLMRSLVREYNIYRWAGRMLLDASRIRLHEQLRYVKGINHDTSPSTSEELIEHNLGVYSPGGILRI